MDPHKFHLNLKFVVTNMAYNFNIFIRYSIVEREANIIFSVTKHVHAVKKHQ